MRKLVLIALAAGTLVTVSAPAFAGWYDAFGIYHPTCFVNAWGIVTCI